MGPHPPIKRGRLDFFDDQSPDEYSGSYLKVKLNSGKSLKTRGWPWVQVCVRGILGQVEKVEKASFLFDGSLLVKTKNKEQTKKILKTQKFGNEDCTVTLDERLNTSKGMIYAYDLEHLTESEIVRWFEDFGVVAAKRITRKQGDDSINTPAVILTFNKPTCPLRLKFDYVTYKVRKYVPNPLICYKCGRFGHSEAQCKAPGAVCLTCGDAKHDGTCTAKCISCNETGHTCRDKTCPVWKKEKEICVLKTERDISYAQARREYEMSHQSPVGVARTFSSITRIPSANPTLSQTQEKTFQDRMDSLEKKMDSILTLLGRFLEHQTETLVKHSETQNTSSGNVQLSQPEAGVSNVQDENMMVVPDDVEVEQTMTPDSQAVNNQGPTKAQSESERPQQVRGKSDWEKAGAKKGNKEKNKKPKNPPTGDQEVSPSPVVGGGPQSVDKTKDRRMPSLSRMAFIPDK